MSKNIRVIYLYLVCLILLFIIIGSFVYSSYSIGEYLFPTSYSAVGTTSYENARIESLRVAISSIATFVVSLIIFIYHWRKIEKERKEMEE